MTDQQYARPELLASTEWLAKRLDDPNVRVVDCDEFELYLRAHIKNAVGIRVHHYIKHPDYPSNPTQYPLVAEPDVMRSLMEEMGIGDDTLVVAYDNSGSLYSTRFWWVLNYYGHTNVKVLNGGWKKWFDEGRPTSIDRPPDAGSVTFTPQHRRLAGMHPGLRSFPGRQRRYGIPGRALRRRVGRLQQPGQRSRGSEFRARSTWNGSISLPTTGTACSNRHRN